MSLLSAPAAAENRVVEKGTTSGPIQFGAGEDLLENLGTINGDASMGEGNHTVIFHAGSSVTGTIDGGMMMNGNMAVLKNAGTSPASIDAKFNSFDTITAATGAWVADKYLGTFLGVSVATGASLEIHEITDASSSTEATIIASSVAFPGPAASRRRAGTLTFEGLYSYTGTTTISGGAVKISGRMDPSSKMNLTSGTLDISGAAQTIAELAGAQAASVNVSNSQLTVNQATNTTFGGSIVGNGGLVKTGTGLLNLTGTTAIPAQPASMAVLLPSTARSLPQ